MSPSNFSPSQVSKDAGLDDKSGTVHLDVVRTISRVPGNPNYHEKNGLRTEGDGVNHERYNRHATGFIMTVIGCALALAGSQIYPLLYLTLGSTIAQDLGRTDLYLWMSTAGILAMGAISPFIGPLADMLGRKSIFLIGFVFSIVGSVVCAATPTAAGYIAGQIFLGFGAVIQELLAIAVVSEIVPTAKRPLYTAIILSAIIPWSPGTLYANFIATSSWRWIGLCLVIWNLVNAGIIAVWYRPPPRVNALGLSKKEQLSRIDFLGGAMLILALILFLVGLNWGGTDYPWKSGHVIGFLVSGVVVFLVFVAWEFFGAPFPLYPRRIVHKPRPFFCILFVIFAAGINYIPLVVFWPLEAISVFQADLYRLGIYALPIGPCILGGAILSAGIVFALPKQAHWVMFGFCVMQTIASACMVLIDPHNIKTAWAPIILALIGVGGVLVPNQVLITVITPDDLIASVTALTVGLRAQCQVVGITLFYNRFTTEVTKNVVKFALNGFIEANLLNLTIIVDMVSAMTSTPFDIYAQRLPQLVQNPAAAAVLKEGLIQAFIHSFKEVWLITIAFGVFACIAAFCMGSVSQYMDKHVAVVL